MTKATFQIGAGPNDVGSSRQHLTRAVERSLERPGTGSIDLFQVHGFDATTPIEETLPTLDDWVRAGKVRYLGCSNFSRWHWMRSLAISRRHSLERSVAHQCTVREIRSRDRECGAPGRKGACPKECSLVGRDFEWGLLFESRT